MNYNKNVPANEYHGLLNQGATCYLNSVLQVLFMTEDFREAVERNTSGNPDPKCIDGPLRTLFEDLKGHEAYTYNISRKLGIDRVYEQRDAAECFEKILNITSPEASQIFHGLLTHKTICSTCGEKTDTDGAFWHLPLELVDSYSQNYRVVDGIEEHFRDTYFNRENQMYCEQCDAKSDATIECVMKHHPEVLMLLLKRFQFDYNYMTNVKNNRTVIVPRTLKIPENQTYELYGIVDHSGGLRGGHYTATIKSQDDERWYNFNDSWVTLSNYQPFQEDEFETSSAYLLFYRKKNVHAAGTCTQDNREVSSPEVLPPATSVKSVDDLNNFTGRLDDSRHMSSQGHINTSYYDQKFKQEDSSTHAGCDNPQQAQKDEERSLLEVNKDKDVKMQGDKKSETIEKAPAEYLMDRDVDVGRMPFVVDNQGGEERTEDVKKDKDGKTGAHERVMASGNEKSLTKCDLYKGVCDSEHNLSQDYQSCEQRSSSRYETHDQQREDKRDFQREKEQKKTGKNEQRERRETSIEKPNPNPYISKGVNVGQMKTYEDVSVDRQGGEEKMDVDVKEDKYGERGMASGTGKHYPEYDLCEGRVSGKSKEDMGEGKQGPKQLKKTYQVKLTEDEIEMSSGIKRSSKTKNIGKVIAEGSSRGKIKSRVEYNEGNDPKGDDEVTLSHNVCSLTLGESTMSKPQARSSKEPDAQKLASLQRASKKGKSVKKRRWWRRTSPLKKQKEEKGKQKKKRNWFCISGKTRDSD